ncbi:hypothetical protein [Candidatus Williamhamiltonella defendens]|uniref:Uncharacterized protein n=1 Tax=Candidatus Hamiltonella defensa (Bemisia tabaci) TaxID=672795 RepID=A0A249DXA1_9ENTR|nr:hypothetical protein [Candidatus Hamiltonella defensa]ASX25885.1 hypothetical protein BA171_01710 [Candidatus Hamiltonella defensa (Bemisia tabaci)]CED78266.1 Conserved hypothetical protein [Candidatus Hamiltonella defensa (Bemisia tabaci)]
MKKYSRLDLLMAAVNRWLEQPKASRSKITAEIVQSAEDCGLTEQLANEGITFNCTDDIYNDMRVNAQKIFRWLGHYEGIHPFHDRLWHIEVAILGAMPENLRLNYLNDVYGVIGALVCARQRNGQNIDATRMAASLTKEQMEAQISVIELGSRPDLHAAKTAYREVSEAVATGTAVLAELERTFPELSGKKKAAGGQESIQRRLKVL